MERGKRGARALTDLALLQAMRDGAPDAWSEFIARLRPLMERYAQRIGIPDWEARTSVIEVIEDEALRMTTRDVAPPRQLSAYLCRALYHRHLKTKRAALRGDRRVVGELATGTERVVTSLCSEHALTSSSSPLTVSERHAESPMRRFALLLSAELSTEELELLTWVAEQIPRRDIAGWLGISYDAAKKRIARLSLRVRQTAISLSARLTDDERDYVERFLRRAGPVSTAGGGVHQ